MKKKQVVLNNGVRLYSFRNSDELIDFAIDQKGMLVAVNAEKILHATEQTKSIMSRNIAYSDGAGAVMALRKKGAFATKIPGCELWLKILDRLVPENKSFYLVGSKQVVIDKVVAKLKRQYQGINIVNYRNGYIQSPVEKQRLLNDIVNKKPDVVFVAMGSPKQELLMEEMLALHPAIYQGLGGSFDVYVNHAKRAPKWWIDHNLEFAYRLVKEPKRIKRQLFLFKYIYMLVSGKL